MRFDLIRLVKANAITLLPQTLLTGCIVTILTGCQPSSTSDTTALNEAPEPIRLSAHAESLFNQNCAMCHGLDPNTNNSLTVLFPYSKSFTDETTFTQFLRAKKPFAMPPFSPEELSDQDAAVLYQGLKAAYTSTPSAAK